MPDSVHCRVGIRVERRAGDRRVIDEDATFHKILPNRLEQKGMNCREVIDAGSKDDAVAFGRDIGSECRQSA